MRNKRIFPTSHNINNSLYCNLTQITLWITICFRPGK